MNGELKEISVGAIVVAVFFAVMVYLYGGQDDLTDSGSGIRVSANFNRVDGLVEGDPVYVSGIRVGSVEKMWLDNNFRAIVSFWLKDGIVLPGDSSAAIHTDGIFGSKFVVLEPGASDSPLKSGDTITFTQDAVIVSELMDLIIAEGNAKKAAREKQN